MSGNDEISIRDFGDSSQLTHWILDSGATCHMTPHVSYFIPVSFKYTNKYVEVADGNNFTDKQKGQVQIKMCDNNRDTFIAIFHNILFAPEICNRFFSNIMLMNSRHTGLFQEGSEWCTLAIRRKMMLLYHMVHIENMNFW